jgi:HEAT repeat protein
MAKVQGRGSFLEAVLGFRVQLRAGERRSCAGHEFSAAPHLIRILKAEQDSGVIEQTALALEMLGAKAAVPVLKDRTTNPSPQTRMWILGAIEVLDSKKDVTFFAAFLSDKDQNVAALAAHFIERSTGQDFGFPRYGPGPYSYGDGVTNAQSWWNTHKQEWNE